MLNACLVPSQVDFLIHAVSKDSLQHPGLLPCALRVPYAKLCIPYVYHLTLFYSLRVYLCNIHAYDIVMGLLRLTCDCALEASPLCTLGSCASIHSLRKCHCSVEKHLPMQLRGSIIMMLIFSFHLHEMELCATEEPSPGGQGGCLMSLLWCEAPVISTHSDPSKPWVQISKSLN